MCIQHCLELNSNMVVVMGTGEGKSMLWQVPVRLQLHIKNVMVISSAANLVDQHKRAIVMGVEACHY